MRANLPKDIVDLIMLYHDGMIHYDKTRRLHQELYHKRLEQEAQCVFQNSYFFEGEGFNLAFCVFLVNYMRGHTDWG